MNFLRDLNGKRLKQVLTIALLQLQQVSNIRIITITSSDLSWSNLLLITALSIEIICRMSLFFSKFRASLLPNSDMETKSKQFINSLLCSRFDCRNYSLSLKSRNWKSWMLVIFDSILWPSTSSTNFKVLISLFITD